ncbi:acyltransferase family protein [Spirosoma agri]|uniref:Acyltransferase n=1 Tax=Spirosoma agri TaxID=1987381 RepID=A0A6M0ILW5_9BACT|nr:acyltransferase [Spirosoma agri]NEU69319.1 acyltransferase [Spirosoma agri]
MSGTRKHVKNLDGVRGIAVVLVLLVHGGHGHFEGGWIGVDIFFVLSGYLITSLLQNEFAQTGTIDLKKFYARRALRLVPALLIGVLLGNLIWPYWQRMGGGDGDRTLATMSSLFYFTNCISGSLSGPMAHLWSLSVEEHFYFFWPLVVLFFLFSAPFSARLLFIGALIAGVSAFRIYVYSAGNPTFGLFMLDSYRFTFCRIDTILLGSGLAIYLKHKPAVALSRKTYTAALFTSLGLLAIVTTTIVRENEVWNLGGFLASDLLCLAIVCIAINMPDHVLLTNPVIRWFGTRSYGLYVYHISIFFAFELFREPHNTRNLLMISVLRFATSFIIAELSYRYLEQPILRYKARFKASTEFVELEPAK